MIYGLGPFLFENQILKPNFENENVEKNLLFSKGITFHKQTMGDLPRTGQGNL